MQIDIWGGGWRGGRGKQPSLYVADWLFSTTLRNTILIFTNVSLPFSSSVKGP